jgi:hypothetical protein
MPIHAGLMKQDAKSRVAGLALRTARERIFGPQGELKHVMLYCGSGMVAGSNNTCIFGPTPGGGWECLDLRNFFGGKQFNSHGVRMIYTPLWGQTIRRAA